MVMNRAMKFRIYPNQEQRILFAKTFGCTRFIWNHLFADRIRYFEETGEVLNNTPAQYKEQYPWLREVDSLALANTQLDLNQAFKNHKKNPAHFGFPTFKAKHRTKKSYTTNNQKGSIRIEGKKIKLPKVGFVPIVQHRAIPDHWSIKSVTVTETPTGKYFVSILFEFESQEIEKKKPQNFVGLDFSMHIDTTRTIDLKIWIPIFIPIEASLRPPSRQKLILIDLAKTDKSLCDVRDLDNLVLET